MANTRQYLCTVPDDVKMTREYFVGLMKRFRHHRSVSYGFSTKHTKDVEEYRRSVGADGNTVPGNVYSLPIEWNTEVTYVK